MSFTTIYICLFYANTYNQSNIEKQSTKQFCLPIYSGLMSLTYQQSIHMLSRLNNLNILVYHNVEYYRRSITPHFKM